MTVGIYSALLIVNFFFKNNKKFSKIILILSFITIVFLAGGAGPNYLGQNDYINYKIRYDRVSNVGIFSTIDIGYTLLMKLGQLLHLDFLTFRIVIIGLCYWLLYKFLIKNAISKSNYIISLYILYPMIIDCEQFRNFIAMSIFLISINYLNKRTHSGRIHFMVFYFIAVSFHQVFIFYGVFFLLFSNNRKLFIRIIVFLVILFSAGVMINNNNIPFVNEIINVINNDKANIYFISKTNLGYLIPMTLHCTTIILLFWSKRIISKKKNALRSTVVLQKEMNLESDFVDMVFYVNLICVVYFPLFILNIQFYRLIRNLLLLNYMAYMTTLFRMKRWSANRLIYFIVVLMSVILWVVLDLLYTTSAERLILQFFFRNLFFN